MLKNSLRPLDVCLRHAFPPEASDKNKPKRRKRRKRLEEDTAIAFCRMGPLDLEEIPPKYRELSLSQKHLNTSRHGYGKENCKMRPTVLGIIWKKHVEK